MDANEQTAARLRAVLAARRIPTRQFAGDIDRSVMWLTRRLNCETPISINDLHLIAGALDMPVSALVPDGPLDLERVTA